MPGGSSFNGSLLVSVSVVDSNVNESTDNKLYANKGDTIRVSFEDSCPLQTASVYGTAKNVGSIILSVTDNDIHDKSIRSGGVLKIVVEDADLNAISSQTEEIECR